jgi:2-C-methyl-D-erythritol 4-phosphate cytidylyltransferase
MFVAAIIVAAGSSRRLGEPKQLILIDGEPLLQCAIRCAEEEGASPVFGVLGAHRELIQNSIDFGAAEIVVNNEWEEGLASSVRAGVKSVQAEAPLAEAPVADGARSAAEARLAISLYVLPASFAACSIAERKARFDCRDETRPSAAFLTRTADRCR